MLPQLALSRCGLGDDECKAEEEEKEEEEDEANALMLEKDEPPPLCPLGLLPSMVTTTARIPKYLSNIHTSVVPIHSFEPMSESTPILRYSS